MIAISKRAQNIKPSATMSISAKAGEMKSNGIDVVSMSAGEPDFDTPQFIKDAAKKALDEGFTKYTATSGIKQLKQAICDKLKKDNNLEYGIENILVSAGAKQVLYNLMLALLDPGDEALIPLPYWVSYAEMVNLADGKCVFLPANKEFKVDPQTIEKHVTAKTKLIIIGSPSNPTGAVYSQKELEEIAKVCLKHNIFVITDDIYEKLIYDMDFYTIAQFSPEMKKMTAVVNGFSKAFAMTGWRIGYVAAEADIIKAATKIQDHSTSNANSITQKAALAALTGDQSCVGDMRKTYQKRRDYMVKRLNAIEGISAQTPNGAFYVFPNISKLYSKDGVKNSTEFCAKLLEDGLVAAVPGIAFGDDECMRLSYATSDENIKKALDRIEKFAKNL